jgi:hypothetical protein
VVRSAQKLAGRKPDVAAATSGLQRATEAPEPALHPSHRSHRRDYAVLAEQNRAAVQGAIRLTFGRHEHHGTGRNVVLACRNKSNDRHIGGDINFSFRRLYLSPSLFDRQRPYLPSKLVTVLANHPRGLDRDAEPGFVTVVPFKRARAGR